jgi:hypothetical protein
MMSFRRIISFLVACLGGGAGSPSRPGFVSRNRIAGWNSVRLGEPAPPTQLGEPAPPSLLSRAGLPVATLAFALFLAAAAHAQSVRWERGDSGVAMSAQLVFENCAPDGEPQLPSLPGVTFQRMGETTSTNIVNFQVTRSVILPYVIRARQNTPVQIPAFSVKTNTGPVRVDAYTIGAPATPIDSIAASKLMPERNSVWAGEVFGLTYELTASRRNNPQISPAFEWNAAPLVAEDWSKPEVTESLGSSNERRANVTFRTRAIAKAPAKVKLEAANHLLSIQTGSVGSFFGPQPRMEQVSVVSDQPTIEVKTLPTPPRGFSGAVGQFKLVSKIVPEKAAVGEPVTWTLELTGMGNWPDIAGLPSREVSNDFQVVQPKAKRTPVEGKLFDATLIEDVVLVPTKTGTYTLGPINFAYFDPKAGAYKTISAPRTTVTIVAPTASQFKTTPGERAEEGPSAEPADKKLPPPTVARAPSGIPRDPLPGVDEVRVPLSPRALAVRLVSPIVGLLLLWTWLAVQRAQQTDPERPRREARQRIARVLSQLQTAAEADRPPLLIAWQRDTALLWQISHAAPPATALPDQAWITLWNEADRALYGAQPALPADWIARAHGAVVAKRVPGFRPLRLFLPQNLVPFAAALALLLLVTPLVLHAAEETQNPKPKTQNPGNADTADAAYRKGDFAAAEKRWRDRIATVPTDWIARHNLSLALAQQERASEAAAQAIAAFVQHPAHPSVRWHFALAAEKSGAIPAPLNGFLAGGPLHSLARLASPAQWQLALIAATWVGAAAVACLLLNVYGQRRRGVTLSATIVLVVCFALAGSALVGGFSYGIAAKAEAAVVARAGTLRSIPTEADTTQKTSPLAAGALARVDKTFLGWAQLAFENGQTGWVRKEEIVPIWK